MKLTKPENVEFVEPKAGLTACVISSIIDVGSSPNPYDDGKMKRQFMMIFSLPKQLHTYEPKDGEESAGPVMLTISKFFTASLHEKSNLYGFISDLGITIDGEYEVMDLLGVNAMINIVEHVKDDGSKRMKVSSVAPLMEEIEAVTIPTSKFELDDYKPAEWDALSEGIQKLIANSPEYKALSGPYADIDKRQE